MTREKVIKVLSDIDHAYRNFTQEEYVALEMAIQSLEQEQTDEWQNGYDMAWEEAKVFYEVEPTEDTVSRQAVIELLPRMAFTSENRYRQAYSAIENLPSVQPKPIECEDAISRQAVLDIAKQHTLTNDYLAIQNLPSFRPQEPKTEQFAEWVAREIFDDMWEYNKDAFAEIACRKLAKLGIVREKGDVWELVEPQESEDRNDLSCCRRTWTF